MLSEEIIEPNRWYTYVGLRDTYYSMGISGEIWIYENNIASSSRSDFINFCLTLVRLTIGGYESFEVGYFQDYSGYWFYTANRKAGIYRELRHNTVVPNSGIHFLKLLEANERFEAYVDNQLVDYMTFSVGVSASRIYSAQGESSDPTNPMRGRFWTLQYITDSWHPWMIIKPYQDAPYYTRLNSTDAYYSTLLGDINVDYLVNSVDVGEINYHFYDRFLDPNTGEWVYIIGPGGYAAHADINHDGLIELQDIMLLNTNWEKSW